MPKFSYSDSSTLNDTHSSKKWFSKISLKIPKKLKNGKNTSSLSNAIHNEKKNNNLENTEALSKCNPDSNVSVQTIYESSNENTSFSSGTFLSKDAVSIHSSQLTINTTKNESTVGSSCLNLDINETPILFISSTPSDKTNPEKDTQNKFNDVNFVSETGLRPDSIHRSKLNYINTPVLRPRSYSDTPVPNRASLLYSDDEYISDNKSFESSRNVKTNQKMMKDNYFMDKEYDLYDIKTPVNTIRNKQIDTSSLSTPSNTIIGKHSIHNTSVNTTPVMKHRDFKLSSPVTPDKKLMDLIEMQQKSCGNMTAKEFALAVGINYRCSDSDSSDDEDNENSIETLSSTLSQLTANGKIPTANEIYNALSIKSLGRQRRKHSTPILNLDMFIPPTPEECNRSTCSYSSNDFSNTNNSSIRTKGSLSHKYSNSKLEKKLPPSISTTNISNDSGSTCVNSKYSSSSSNSSFSGNTNYMSDLPENEIDSYYMNSCSPELNGKNGVASPFYSLPRVTFHNSVNNSSICASKSVNSVPSSNYYISNYNSYRDMGIGCNPRRHNRVASCVSINSQSSLNKKAPSSPRSLNSTSTRSVTPSPTLQSFLTNANASKLDASKSDVPKPDVPKHDAHKLDATKLDFTKIDASDSRNMYINSKTISSNNINSVSNTSSPTNSSHPISSSWSNGLSAVDYLPLSMIPKVTESSNGDSENQVKVYTKGRFTITHETYGHKRSTSTHKFQVEKC